MIFVLLTDERTLMVYESAGAAIQACEGIDVEDGVCLFFNAAGRPLQAVFDEPNSRSSILVRSGRYHLQPAADAAEDLLSLLPGIPRVHGSPIIKDAADVERLVMARRAMPEIIETREFKVDLQRLMRAMARDSRSKSDAWFRKWFPVVLIGMAMWIAYQLFATSDIRGALGGLIVGLVAGGVITFVLGWVIPWLSGKISVYKGALGPRRYRFDADTLFLETADGIALRAPYRTFSMISLHPGWILVYEAFPGFAAHAIPAEAFESKEHEATVREWLAPYAK